MVNQSIAFESIVNMKEAVASLTRLNEQFEKMKQWHDESRADIIANSAKSAASAVGLPDEVLCPLVNDMYWDGPSLAQKEIIAITGIDTKRLRRLIKPRAVNVSCELCGGTIEVRSRTHVSTMRYHKRMGLKLTCAKCDAAEAERRHVRWEEERRTSEERERAYKESIAIPQDLHGDEGRLDLRSMPYKDYLKTDHWKTTRYQSLRRAKFSCQLCNAKTPLHVHHRTYERRGSEIPSDLIVLCAPCHAKFHDKLEPEPE